jgi:3-hydroxy-3-methylglutaryl CoA synthase
MGGILGWGVHIPHRRLDRSTIAPVAGVGGGKGTRVVASYDEDTTTMAVAAARRLLAGTTLGPRSLWLATTTPAYLDKTNATAVHAALRLDRSVGAYDAVGSVRSTAGTLTMALQAPEPTLVVASDLRSGRPGSPDESAGADAAAALLVGEGDVVADLVGRTSVSEEFLDRWRVPSDAASRVWEERYGETKYVPLATEALKLALGEAGVGTDQVDGLVVAGLHERAVTSVMRKAGVAPDRLVDRLAASVGNPGAAQPFLLLASALEQASPGQLIVLLVLSDGADCFVFRTTAALASYTATPSVASQVSGGALVSYGRYLAWRGMLAVEPPRRPEPARPSASASGRNGEWKFGLATPAGALAEQQGTVTTFTIDKLAYSPSPPVVFAVVDFDDGERLPVELTDVDPDEVTIGMRVEMTFRRLFTADGIANYFWKARPVRGVED